MHVYAVYDTVCVLILTVGHDCKMCVCVCVRARACVLCITLFRVLMLTVGHDNTPKCMCMLRMTLFRVLILTVGHDSKD